MENPIALIEAHQKRVDKMNEESLELELPDNHNAYQLLQALYRCKALPIRERARYAIANLPYETPKLAVTAVVSENDLATLLDKRIAKLQAMEQQKLLEAKPVGGNADARLPPPIPDKRFRRI